jgi:hypothetical protein
MSDAQGEPGKSSSKSKFWDGVKADLANEGMRAVADIGSTFQACLYSGWHTQSAAIASPEHIAEDAAKQQEQNKVEPEEQKSMVGLEKE